MDPENASKIVNSIPEIIAAIGALGMAAFGLVDGAKAFWGGPSNFGFGYIIRGVAPFAQALDSAVGAEEWRRMLRAHWLAGRSKDEQKSVAKAMVRLGMKVENAASLAKAGRVDAEALAATIRKLENGKPLTPDDMNVLGRLDTAIEMTLDAAFERADSQYKNVARALAGAVAVGISIFSAIYILKWPPNVIETWLKAALIGAVAVPVAPIAKDLSTTVTAAVRALSGVKA